MENKFAYQVEHLSFSYGKERVIQDLSFHIKEGSITTLVGANGCGKSTLFQLLTKNLKPQKGKILLKGKNIESYKLKEFARQVAIVHQYNTAPLDLTVEKLVAYGRFPYHTMGRTYHYEKDEEKIRRAMEITNIWKYREKSVTQLSGGQKQRVWIAMALAQDTDILFLDEPTTYLDVRYQIEILRMIRQLNREYGITIAMILHDMNQSLHYSDEVVAMKEGQVVRQGQPEKIFTSQLVTSVYGISLPMQEINGRPFILPV